MIAAFSKWRLPRATGDLVALGMLSALVLGVAGFLIRNDVFLYGDHPGHYWVMWHVINVAIPQHARAIDWMPSWYAGYPELQFYPPGFAFLGWLIHTLALGRLPTPLVYEIVVVIAYALPAYTFYYALRRLRFGIFAAFLAGLFGLLLPAFFDGAVAVWIGMLGSRLAWGLDALVFAWMIDLLEKRGARFVWLTALTIAAQILARPYHLLGVLFALGVYILARRLPLLPSIARVALVVVLALALDAFWLAPLVAYSSAQMIPLIRSTLDQTWHIITDASLLPYAVFAVMAFIGAWRERDASRRAVIIALVALCLAFGTAMLGLHALVITQFHFYQLDPIRLIGEFYFPLLLLAAIGATHCADWVAQRIQVARAIPRAVSLIALALILGSPLLESTTPIYPRANGEPRFLSQATTDYRLAELWEVLREDEGRVLFTSYKTHLNARGNESLPTTLLSLTPLFTQRQIMGGTFSAWSPIAALMRTGKLNPPALWGLSEEQDDLALFGIPLEKLSDAKLFEYCQRYNITTIVASANDFQTRTWLDTSAHFKSYYNNGFLFVYRVNDYENSWLATRNANVELITWRDDEIVMRVHSANDNARVTVKIAAYPLWRATTDRGQALTITHDAMGLQEITLPRGDTYTVTLRYTQDTSTQIGNGISMLALLGIVAGIVFVSARRF